MEFFEASGNWIVALGKTLVHSLWIGLLLLSALKITLQFIPGRYSLFRYRMATVSLFVFIVMIMAVFFILYAPLQDLPGNPQPTIYIPLLLPSIHGFSISSGGSHVMLICTVSCYIYFTGILVMLIRSVLSFSLIRKIKREGIAIQGEWYNRFLQIKLRLGIRKSVTLLESNSLNVPALVGLLKPAIIVPAGMFTHLSMDQAETILVHELYHLKRLDFLVNIIQLFVEGLFFYNPAVWAISRIIRSERENCCDDQVLQSCEDPLVYARALFQLAGHHQQLHQLIPGAGGRDQFQLLSRIKRILKQTAMKTNIREKLFSFMLLAGGMIILITVSAFSSGFSITRHQDSRQEVGPSPIAAYAIPLEKAVLAQDTLPKADQRDLEKIDEKDLERAKEEALESIDWEKIKKDMEAAKLEALESIDWEEIKRDMEAAKLEALESIDWEEIKRGYGGHRPKLRNHWNRIDWEDDKEIEASMEEVDWIAIRKEIEGDGRV